MIHAIPATLILAALASIAVACMPRASEGASAESLATAAAPPAVDSMQPSAEMQRVLDAHAALAPKAIETLTPAEARQQPTPADAVMQVLLADGRDTSAAALVPGVTSVDRTIPGPASPLAVRIYTPAGEGPFPVIVYYHGGGWVIASKEVYDGGARALAKGANAIVVSVDYRLAPEHKFPAQHDDALAGYRWVVKNAGSFKGLPKRVALAGESAGGNLAVATGVAAIAAGLQKPIHILSVYPIVQVDTTTASYIANASAKPLNRAMMGWFARHVSRTPADLQDPRISLLNANLTGLPPVTIINATIDPLFTEGEMLETALRNAGVDVIRRTWHGVTHEFFGMAAVLGAARIAQQFAVDRLVGDFVEEVER